MTPDQAFEDLCATYGKSVCFQTSMWRGSVGIYTNYSATVFLDDHRICVTSGNCPTPQDALREVSAKVQEALSAIGPKPFVTLDPSAA